MMRLDCMQVIGDSPGVSVSEVRMWRCLMVTARIQGWSPMAGSSSAAFASIKLELSAHVRTCPALWNGSSGWSVHLGDVFHAVGGPQYIYICIYIYIYKYVSIYIYVYIYMYIYISSMYWTKPNSEPTELKQPGSGQQLEQNSTN